jgi:single-strand DNA-binding protein
MSIQLIATGNLVTDPMLRFSNAGKAVCTFRIACDTGKEKPTVYKDCVCFTYVAENLAGSCLKGDRVIVRGRLETQAWTGKDNKEYSKDVIIAEEIGASLQFAQVEYQRKTKEDYSGENTSDFQSDEFGMEQS